MALFVFPSSPFGLATQSEIPSVFSFVIEKDGPRFADLCSLEPYSLVVTVDGGDPMRWTRGLFGGAFLAECMVVGFVGRFFRERVGRLGVGFPLVFFRRLARVGLGPTHWHIRTKVVVALRRRLARIRCGMGFDRGLFFMGDPPRGSFSRHGPVWACGALRGTFGAIGVVERRRQSSCGVGLACRSRGYFRGTWLVFVVAETRVPRPDPRDDGCHLGRGLGSGWEAPRPRRGGFKVGCGPRLCFRRIAGVAQTPSVGGPLDGDLGFRYSPESLDRLWLGAMVRGVRENLQWRNPLDFVDPLEKPF